MNDFWKSYDITHANAWPELTDATRCMARIHSMELALSLVAFIVGRPCGIAAVLPLHPAAHLRGRHRFAPAGR
ncbi:MAG: hypothetical protein ACLVJH_04455 [Faecalibacterium prausnitzii]